MPFSWALGAALEGAAFGAWCPALAATGARVATTVAAEGMGRGRPASLVAPALEASVDHEERIAPAASPLPSPWQPTRAERRGDERAAQLSQLQSMSQESTTSSSSLFEPLWFILSCWKVRGARSPCSFVLLGIPDPLPGFTPRRNS